MAGSRNLRSGNGSRSLESEQTKYSHFWYLGNRLFSGRASAWKSRFPKVRNHPLSAAMNYMTDWPLAVF